MKNIIKGLAIFSCSLTILALCVIESTPPATGYEFSIYKAFPSVLWFLLLASNACGILILITGAFTDTKDSRVCILGLYLLLFNNFIILCLPFFRGYPIYNRGDTLIHLGCIKDIISYNHLNEDNFYPMVHILGAVTSLLGQIDPRMAIYVLIPIFPILYIISIFLLANRISKNKSQCLLITAFGCLPLLSASYTPSGAAFSLLPLVIYLFFSSWLSKARISYNCLLILFLIAMSFFHSLIGAYLIVILVCFQVSLLAYKKITYKSKRKELFPTLEKLNDRNLLNLIFIASISWFTWFSTFSMFGGGIRRVLNFLFDISQSQTMRYISLVERANMSTYEFIELFIRMHGQYILYIIPSIILCTLLFKSILSHRKVEFPRLAFSTIFIFFMILTFISAMCNIIITYDRILKYVIFAATILNGFGIYTHLEKARPKVRTILCGMVILLLISSQAFALFNLFPSPIIKKHNYCGEKRW